MPGGSLALGVGVKFYRAIGAFAEESSPFGRFAEIGELKDAGRKPVSRLRVSGEVRSVGLDLTGDWKITSESASLAFKLAGTFGI